jgi:predicted transcriptional regulator
MITVRQMKAARALLAWSQGDLADASGVSEPTIARLESEDGEVGGRPETGQKLVAALEKAGIEFIGANGEGAGAKMKKRAKRG